MIRLTLKFTVWIARRGLMIVLLLIPWVLKALFLALLLVATSIGSLRVGVHKTAKKIADEWVARAIKSGVPPSWERFAYSAALVLAFLTLVAGWTSLAFTTAFIVRAMLW